MLAKENECQDDDDDDDFSYEKIKNGKKERLTFSESYTKMPSGHFQVSLFCEKCCVLSVSK